MALKFMYITNSRQIATIAQEAGVDRIWIDLECLGKEERQAGYDSVKSKHSLEDIRKIKPIMSLSKLVVRINPINENSIEEINTVITYGADIIMLPMIRTTDDVIKFIKYVRGRARTCLLLETAEGVANLDEIIKQDGIDEIHIGLNDLHLSYGLKFMFELLSNGTVEMICNKIGQAGIPFGFGGVGKLGSGLLKAEYILAEHYRLHSSQVILSRSFCNPSVDCDLQKIKKDFINDVCQIRELECVLRKADKFFFVNNKEYLDKTIKDIVNNLNTYR